MQRDIVFMKKILFRATVSIILMIASTKSVANLPTASCSSEETYSEILYIISDLAIENIKTFGSNSERDQKIANAASFERISAITSFDRTLTEKIDKDIRRIYCRSTITVDVNPLLLSGMNISKDFRIENGKVTMQINYAIQPDSDNEHYIYELWDAEDISSVAVRASLLKVPSL